MPVSATDLEMLDVKFRPLSRRRRLLILLLAIATAITIALLLLYPPGGIRRTHTRVLPALCTAGQTTHCIGGRSDIIAVPAAGADASSAAGPSRPREVAEPGG